MKTLHTAYRVSDLERALAFYRTVGFREIGRVAPGDESLLVMLHLPDDGNVVTLELVHAPARGTIEMGTGFSHIAVQVADLAATLAPLAAAGSSAQAARPDRRSVPSTIRTATASNSSSGHPVTRTA